MQINEITTVQASTTTSLNIIKTDLNDLASHMVSELQESDLDVDSEDEEEEEEEPEGHLLIGDSLLRNIEPKIDDIVINYVSGAKYVDTRKRLEKMRGRHFKDITIVCGTTGSVTKKPVEKIVEECRKRIEVTKVKGEHVHLSSILPRQDDRADMVIIANEQDIEFINNDENFRYRNDSVDESMMLPSDNLHLSNTGIKRLLGNLGLSDMASSELENDITNKWKHSHRLTSMPNACNKGTPP